jgi:carbon monoxide dehydrogenase subunit G
MDISSSYTLNAPREQVWNALRDPDLLKRAIPGCESLEQTGDNQYAVRLNVDVAGLKGVYQGTIRLLDAQNLESYRVVVDGAGARGIVHSDGVLHLTANDAGTTDVHYAGQAQLGGPLASMGAQVASGAAGMLLKRYFRRVDSLLPPAPAAPLATPVATHATAEAALAPAPFAAVEPPPTSAPAEMTPAEMTPAEMTPADAAPSEVFSTPAPAPAESFAPPAAPMSATPSPKEDVAPEVSAAPVTPVAPEAPAAPEAPSSAPDQSSTPARAALSDSSLESQRRSTGFVSVVFALIAVVVIVIVVLVVVGVLR